MFSDNPFDSKDYSRGNLNIIYIYILAKYGPDSPEEGRGQGSTKYSLKANSELVAEDEKDGEEKDCAAGMRTSLFEHH
eukprot:COSAG06_NODE_4397_length_4298_cov_111.854727_3_plen_78_part_00